MINEQEAQEIYAALLSQAKHYQDLRADILKQAAVYERMLSSKKGTTYIESPSGVVTYTIGQAEAKHKTE